MAFIVHGEKHALRGTELEYSGLLAHFKVVLLVHRQKGFLDSAVAIEATGLRTLEKCSKNLYSRAKIARSRTQSGKDLTPLPSYSAN